MTNFDIGDKKQDRIRKSEYALFYSSFFRKSQAPSENRFAAILNRKKPSLAGIRTHYPVPLTQSSILFRYLWLTPPPWPLDGGFFKTID